MGKRDIVSLVERTSKKTGVKTLYLDTTRNGKRHRECLHLYLNPGKDPITKATNKATLEAARTIQAQRIVAIQHGEAEIAEKKASPMLFTDMYREYLKRHSSISESHRKGMETTLKRWVARMGDDVRLKDIDKEMITEFVESLRGDKVERNIDRDWGTLKLNKNTVWQHYQRVVWVLNLAAKEKLIPNNPARQIEDKPTPQKTEREFLTEDELKAMIRTPCRCDDVKRAFLFACYTGLRMSDVFSLTWGNIYNNSIRTTMRKTKQPITIPLSKPAMRYLGERGKDSGHPFMQEDRQSVGRYLSRWAKDAGVKKHITFHVSRHTFATMALTYGGDIYTVSKLLGHAKLSTTLIYAKIVDKRKQEVVNLLPDF